MRHKSIIFDLDGTILDTSVLQKYIEEIKRNPQGTLGNKDAWKQHDEHVSKCRLYDGFNEVFSHIREHDIPTAIVSNSVKRRIEVCCKTFNIPVDKHFMVGRFSCNRFKGIIKPDYRPIELAINLLNTTPGTIVGFGNEPSDIEAYNKAGITSVACLWGCTDTEKEEMLQAQPDHIIYNPIEIIPLLSK